MKNVQIETSQNVAIDVDVAGLGDRVIAALIDYLALFAYTVSILAIGATMGDTGMLVTSLLFLAPVVPFYFLWCEIFLDGQSIGKRYMRLKVSRLDGSSPTIGNYVIRWLLRFVDVTLTNGLAAVLTIFFTQTGQRLGDLAAGTTVIRIGNRTRLEDTVYVEVDDDYEPVFPQARSLSDDHVGTLKEVVNVLENGDPSPDLAEETKVTVEKKLGVTSDMPPEKFLHTVLRDYVAIHGRGESESGSR